MVKKTKKSVYPFTYEEWLNHPSTKPKLEWIKSVCDRIRSEEKNGKQLKLNL